MEKQFSLKKPCANCPFRNDDKAIELQDGRKEQIIEDLLSGVEPSFPCHSTVYRPDGRNFDDDDEYRPVDICHCPGAIAVARKFGRDTTLVQIATRLGAIAPDHYDEALSLTLEPSDLKVDRKKVWL
jgi:hypothetical protein